jgi:hypothetical protein
MAALTEETAVSGEEGKPSPWVRYRPTAASFTPEWKASLSAALIGNKRNLGKKDTPETRLLKSKKALARTRDSKGHFICYSPKVTGQY